MWRDRTGLFLSYRQSYDHRPARKPSRRPANGGYSNYGDDNDESRGLMADSEGDAVIEMDLLPPRWIDIQDEIVERLRGISKQFPQLDRLHHKHALPGFEDDKVKRQEEAMIERMTQAITRDFHRCQQDIKRIEKLVQDASRSAAAGGGLGRGEETMARNMQVSLAGRVQDVSTEFRKKQSAYLKKLRALEGYASTPLDGRSTAAAAAAAAAAAGGPGGGAGAGTGGQQPTRNPYSDPSMFEAEADTSLSRSTLQQSAQKRLLQESSNDSAIAQRERAINDIAKGIIELSDIFKDLQTMIIDQGTMLDRIDYNVERMNTDVKGAEKELIVATDYQKKTTKRKIIFLLILIVVGMLILVVVKPKKSAA